MRELILARIKEILLTGIQGYTTWSDKGRYMYLRRGILLSKGIDPDTRSGRKMVALMTFDECFAVCQDYSDSELLDFFERLQRMMNVQR